MKLNFTISLLVTGLCFQYLSAQSNKNVTAGNIAIDSIIETKMSQAGIVGISASIILDKKVVWTKGYGYANREKQLPFTPTTVINIASISKTFTGACMMKAVGQGKLSLDIDINSYLPFRIVNPYHPNEIITLRHLATHTSGD